MGPLDPSRLGAFLMRQIPPSDGEVVERGNVLPLGTYRTPDGRETTTLAFPQPMREGLDALAYALGYRQDPNAPAGYVTHDALNKGGQGLAESAMVGSLGARAPAGALRSGAASSGLDKSGPARMKRALDQGYGEEILYHGSPHAYSIDEFNLNMPSRTDSGWLGQAVYLTPHEYVARAYAQPMKGKASDYPDRGVLELRARQDNMKDFDYIDTETYQGQIKDFAKSLGVKGEFGTPEWSRDFRNAMLDAGYTGARGVSPGGGVSEIAIYNPSHVRFPDAMFDPSKSDSANLLAANPMAGAVPLAFPAPQEDRNQALARFLASGGA